MEPKISILAFHINGLTPPVSTDRPALQCRLTVRGAPEWARFRLELDGRTLWDSGALPWTGPHYDFDALPLRPRARHTLYALVGTRDGQAQCAGGVETGLMGTLWEAGWIEPEQDAAIPEGPIPFFEQFMPLPSHFGGHVRLRPVQELRRVFQCPRLPARASLYASAHGIYALRLNGARVGARLLAPETTPYQSLLYYQVYDVLPYLRPGENELRVLLADGWWCGRIGLSGESCQYGDRLGFLMELDLYDENGGVERICSDEAFQGRPSPIDYADLFIGERWDLTRPEAAWRPVRCAAGATDLLALQPTAAITVWEERRPAAWLTTPAGELVADFGVCLAGTVRLALDCPAGREVALDHSEVLDRDGNFFRNIMGRNKDQRDVVLCGGGETVFQPEFTYHGFRYVRLSGAAREEVRSLTARCIGTPLEEIGGFSCADERLNQLQRNILRGARSNMVGVPTDCPQREKMGWTGDIQVFVQTGCFNFDLDNFLSAWLEQMRLEQTGEGEIPIVIPSYPAQTAMQLRTKGANSSSAWSDACVLLPLRLYEAYGGRRVLRDNLEMMERWLDFVSRAAAVPPEDYEARDEAGKARCPYLWTHGHHFGDWLIPSFEDDIEGGSAATAQVVASCQYAITVDAYLKILEALGIRDGRAEAARTLLERIRAAVREEYVRADGRVQGDLQGLYVMVLRSGAVRGEAARRVAGRLAGLIEANGCRLDTGFVSVPHLLDVLREHGHGALAWKLLYQTERPSWLYQVAHGATSIWENWNAVRPDGTVTTSSFNHYALGCVGWFMYRFIGGLQPAAPGWRRIRYAPDPDCGLAGAQCSHRTPYGDAACRWTRTGELLEVEVLVPQGVEATLSLPGLERPLEAGRHAFRVELPR